MNTATWIFVGAWLLLRLWEATLLRHELRALREQLRFDAVARFLTRRGK